MKGYKFYNEEIAKRFIDKYEIKDSKIILHMNNKDTLEYQYSQDTLDKITEMQKQNYYTYNEKGLNSNNNRFKLKKAYILLFILSTLVLNAIMLSTGFEFLWSFLTIDSGALLILQIIDGVKTKKNIKELEKQQIYSSIENDLDDETLENKNVSQCLNTRKIDKMNKQKELTGSTFNLTSIDKLSLEELKRLRDNIEREKEFGFESIDKTKQHRI